MFPKPVKGGCFTFYYLMAGDDHNSLDFGETYGGKPLWYKYGSEGYQWRHVMVMVTNDIHKVSKWLLYN